jgi:hypothetical protein
MWGAQVELGNSATTYYPASSSVQPATVWKNLADPAPADVLTQVEILLVGGGGGAGGRYQAGGGGAGGIVYRSSYPVVPTTAYTVTVGAGGIGSTISSLGNFIFINSETQTDGGNSTFDTLTAYGGGKGSSEGLSRSNGGSGGGTSHASVYFGGTGTQPGSSSGGFGNDGGGVTSPNTSPWTGAGGGGAGGVGQTVDEAQATPGSGGPGLPFGISGTTVYYGGGGAGSNRAGGKGVGGIGGGGGTGQSGTANTGGGGGAGSDQTHPCPGGAGGSGVVIISYPTPVRATGGTITIVGNRVVHTFTSGTDTFVSTSNGGGFGYLRNSPVYVPIAGGALQFNGTSQFVDFGDNFDLISSDLTLSIWVNAIGIATNQFAPLLDKYGSNGNYRSYISSGGFGFGIKEERFFIDFAFAHTQTGYYYQPYTLNNQEVSGITSKQKDNRFLITIGFVL